MSFIFHVLVNQINIFIQWFNFTESKQHHNETEKYFDNLNTPLFLFMIALNDWTLRTPSVLFFNLTGCQSLFLIEFVKTKCDVNILNMFIWQPILKTLTYYFLFSLFKIQLYTIRSVVFNGFNWDPGGIYWLLTIDCNFLIKWFLLN